MRSVPKPARFNAPTTRTFRGLSRRDPVPWARAILPGSEPTRSPVSTTSPAGMSRPGAGRRPPGRCEGCERLRHIIFEPSRYHSPSTFPGRRRQPHRPRHGSAGRPADAPPPERRRSTGPDDGDGSRPPPRASSHRSRARRRPRLSARPSTAEGGAVAPSTHVLAEGARRALARGRPAASSSRMRSAEISVSSGKTPWPLAIAPIANSSCPGTPSLRTTQMSSGARSFPATSAATDAPPARKPGAP